jgi:hypothetical protein
MHKKRQHPLVHLNAESHHWAELCSSEDPPSHHSLLAFGVVARRPCSLVHFSVVGLGFKPPVSCRAPLRPTPHVLDTLVTTCCRAWAVVAVGCCEPTWTVHFSNFLWNFSIEIQFNSNLIQIHLKLVQTWKLDQITSNLWIQVLILK